MQSKLKSKLLWASLLSSIIAFLIGSGIIDTNLGGTVNTVVTLALTILTAIGVLNNPSDPTKL